MDKRIILNRRLSALSGLGRSIWSSVVSLLAVGGMMIGSCGLQAVGSFDLMITDESGIDEPWPLVSGLPFPEGLLDDPGKIRILSGGVEIPAQIDVTARWRDGSIRWALAGFTGSPQGSYAVEFGDGVVRAEVDTQLQVKDDGNGAITVDTGVAVYHFRPDELMPASADFAGQPFLRDSGAGAYLADNHGRLARVTGDAAQVTTELLKPGPQRVVVFRQGWYVTESGERLARARAWFYFAAGSPVVRVTHSLILIHDTNELWVANYGLRFHTASQPSEVRFAVETAGVPDYVSASVDKDCQVYLLQDTARHFMSTDSLAVVGKACGSLGPSGGQTTFWTDDWLAAVDRVGDWADIVLPGFGVTAVVPNMAERFPKEIAVDSAGFDVVLWSGRVGRELDFRAETLVREYWQGWAEYAPGGPEGLAALPSNAQGMARTHDLWLLPHAGGDDLAQVAIRSVAAAKPPLVLAAPSWAGPSAAIGWAVHPRDDERYSSHEAMLEDYWRGFNHGYERVPHVGGFLDWGRAPSMRGGGNSFFRISSGTMDYFIRLHVWGPFIRSGERGYFDYGSRLNQFHADLGVAHWTAGSKVEGGETGFGGYANHWVPMYWGSETSMETNVVLSLLNEYYLTGNEHPRYVAGLTGDAFLRHWDPAAVHSLAVRIDGLFSTLRGLASLHAMEWNPAFAEMATQLAAELIDLESPNGLSDQIRFGSLYKIDRNLLWLYFYYQSTGDEAAKAAILKSVDYNYRFSNFGMPHGGQEYSAFLYSLAWRWTGNPGYLRLVHYLLEAGVRTHADRGNAVQLNRHSTFNMPAALALIAEVDDPSEPFPAAEMFATPRPTRIVFRKADDGAPVAFLATAWMSGPDVEPQIRIAPLGDHDRLVGDLDINIQPSIETRYVGRYTPHIYAIALRVPGETPAGLYTLEVPEANRIRIIDSSAAQISIHGPEGISLSGDGMPTYFMVGDDVDSLQLFFSLPMELRRPDGSIAIEASPDAIGEISVPVDGASGAWSVATNSSAIAAVRNVDPVFAKSPQWLVTDAGLTPPPRFEPPSEDLAFVDGIAGQALHLPGDSVLRFPRGERHDEAYAHFPANVGTIEFWFRPNWSTSELPYVIGTNYNDHTFVAAGSHLFQYRRGQRRAGIRQLAALNLWFRDPTDAHAGFTGTHWFEAGEWYHVAMVWSFDPGADTEPHAALFVNGELIEEDSRRRSAGVPREMGRDTAYSWPSPRPESIREADEWIRVGPLNGTITGLRISDVVRYNEPFNPSTSAPAVDAHTRAWFPLTEDLAGQSGSGEPLRLTLGR